MGQVYFPRVVQIGREKKKKRGRRREKKETNAGTTALEEGREEEKKKKERPQPSRTETATASRFPSVPASIDFPGGKRGRSRGKKGGGKGEWGLSG